MPHSRRTGASRLSRRRLTATLLAAVAAVSGLLVAAGPAHAATRPTVTGLSRHRSPYWGATTLRVHGTGFEGIRKVLFEKRAGYALHVESDTRLTVVVPNHRYGSVHVRVAGPAGVSRRSPADTFTFTRPTMTTPILGGWSARQEQGVSAHVRAAHHGVRITAAHRRWTPAMGETAVRRARSWLGLPYSWAGGSDGGPTYGVCAHNVGGDFDCHVVGFDCSGLALYSWSPYRSLIHYAATQYREAGRFHPTVGELMPGDLVFFSATNEPVIGHVAVYAGHGTVIQAAQSGTGVMRSRLPDVVDFTGRYRGATRPMSTGRQGVVPVIRSATTQLTQSGGVIRISGRHLGSVTAASLGGATVYRFVRRAPHHLVLRAPEHLPGRVTLAVSTAWGTARRTVTYMSPPEPTALSPGDGSSSGGTAVTVTGRHLGAVTSLRFGAAPVDFRTVGAHRLTFTTPAHAAGTVPVVLASPWGTSTPVRFTVDGPAPTSASASPTPRRAAAPSRVRPAAPRRRGVVGRFGDRLGDRWYLVGPAYVRRAR